MSDRSLRWRQTGSLHLALVGQTGTQSLKNHTHTCRSKQVTHITKTDLILTAWNLWFCGFLERDEYILVFWFILVILHEIKRGYSESKIPFQWKRNRWKRKMSPVKKREVIPKLRNWNSVKSLFRFAHSSPHPVMSRHQSQSQGSLGCWDQSSEKTGKLEIW